ncbi:hypothetical protein ScPMuIL_011034 [Solemya velum]
MESPCVNMRQQPLASHRQHYPLDYGGISNITKLMQDVIEMLIAMLNIGGMKVSSVLGTTPGLNADLEDHYGKEFVLIFPEPEGEGEAEAFIHLTNSNGVTTTVGIVCANIQPGMRVRIQPSQRQNVRLTGCGSIWTGTKPSHNNVFVSSEHKVAVHVFIKTKLGGDSYLAFPVTTFGRDYYAMTFCEPVGTCQFAVVAVDETELNLEFPAKNNNVFVNGEIVGTQKKTVILSRNETILIESESELTGTG